MLTKSTCQNCGGHLEFDVEDTDKEIECPHCHQTTLLRAPFGPDQHTPATPPRPPASETFKAEAESQSSKKSVAILLDIGAVILLVIGCGMALNGCDAAIQESDLKEPSAVRGIQNVAEYGFGFTVIALSLILAALVRIIRKPYPNERH
jgi:DNA-directed RNA polymerase subunit RPC12/RpoP